ncbi:hypothetical protein MP866_25315, partial [Escherichia coli]
MAVSDQTRSGDLAETFKSERETTKNQIRVALPGIVQSFDPDAVTAVVQPAIRSVESKRAARTVLTGMCYSVGSATRQGSSSPTRFIGQ